MERGPHLRLRPGFEQRQDDDRRIIDIGRDAEAQRDAGHSRRWRRTTREDYNTSVFFGIRRF